MNASSLPSRRFRRKILLWLLPAALLLPCSAESTPPRWWPETVQAILQQAGPNQESLAEALRQATGKERPALQFLLENMPARDLTTLSGPWLRAHASRACAARA